MDNIGRRGGSLDGLRIPIPNHREIAEGTTRSIMRQQQLDVDIAPDLSHVEVSGGTLEALELRRALAELTDRARRQTPTSVAELRQAGLTVRDVSQLLGVTPSRVS